LEEALNSTLLAEDEAIELEVFLHERPAFVWARDSLTATVIDSNHMEDIHVHVHGKRGLTKGVVYLEYAFNDPKSQSLDLHCRQIEFSLAITVNATIELVTCDFLPVARDYLAGGDGHLVGSNDRFLLVLEMRNSWINPMRLALTLIEIDKSPSVISHMLQSGHTRRIILNLPRILLSATKVDNPLPRRNRDRQFVVASATTKDSVTAAREAWWYRQHILDCLTATWIEQCASGRNGNVEMRGIRLNERHARVVKREVVEASLNVACSDESLGQTVRRQLTVVLRNQQGITFCCCQLIG
jgi:hypothetical protein